MLHPGLQIGVGFLFLFMGINMYAQQGGRGPLSMLVTGAILVTVGAVVMNIRQLLRDESRRREQEGKPVLNI
jgi:ABC-type spermidine/putrescine transport system permease subunit II